MLNLSSLKTPGVYIDEVPKFPPSIAAVATAIPAFIGYTFKTEFNGEPFLNKAIEVESLVDYEEKFGGAAPLVVNSVVLEVNNSVRSASMDSSYYLYDSIRMFYKNGGGRCYVITIGQYPDPFIQADLQTSISNAISNVLDLEDEPTLIVFPDGIKLTPTQLGTLHSVALTQCEKYKDRFLIADVIIGNPASDRYNSADISDFKTAIGMGNLQFGAAYYPYIQVNLPREVHYRDIRNKVTKLGVQVNWVNDFVDSDDTETKDRFDKLDKAVQDTAYIKDGIQLPPILPGISYAVLEEKYLSFKSEFQNTLATFRSRPTGSNRDNVKNAAVALFNYSFAIAHTFMDQLAKETAPPLKGPLLKQLGDRLDTEVQSAYIEPLAKVDKLLRLSVITTNPSGPIYSQDGRTWEYEGDLSKPTKWKEAITMAPDPPIPPRHPAIDADGLSDISRLARGDARPIGSVDNIEIIVNKYSDDIFYGLLKAVDQMYKDAMANEVSRESDVFRRIPVMAGVISHLKSKSFLLPPSGAVAGVYARVDNNQGVWKAPANESLNNVVAPSLKLSHEEHGNLNLDPNFGKSINVIRHYTGKGILVFGARTLKGNDNEWRYVSVRRLFNMVEESSKKATEQFVFESNDKSTWVRVQAMIENFLTTLWRQGAFFGATTEQAFYVLVGLGKTMTAQDILAGRMIVEIGLAVVRPAEFIVLRFSHKLPEA